MIGKNEKLMKWFLLIFCCTHILKGQYLAWFSSEKFYPATNWNRFRNPQSNIRRSIGNPEEERTVGVREVEYTRRIGPQSQWSRVHSDSQRLKQQSYSLYRTDLSPLHICYGCVPWCFCGNLNSESRCYFVEYYFNYVNIHYICLCCRILH